MVLYLISANLLIDISFIVWLLSITKVKVFICCAMYLRKVFCGGNKKSNGRKGVIFLQI